MSSIVAPLLATYWLHAAVVTLAALAFVPRLRSPAVRARFALATLLLPVVTTPAAVLLGGAGVERRAVAPVAQEADSAAPRGGVPDVGFGALEVPAASIAAARVALDPAAWLGGMWRALLVGAWLCAAAVAGLRLALAARRWRAILVARRSAGTSPTALACADVARRMGWRTPPRVSVARGLVSPVALGRRVVALPADALAGLGDEARDAVLAHELAHLERRDPAWILLVTAIVRVAAPQPLLAVLARRWRRDLELVCDRRAADVVGGRAVAEGLWRIAERAVARPRAASFAPAALDRPSALVDRVANVLAAPRDSARGAVLATALCGVVLAAALGCVSVTGGAASHGENDGSATAVMLPGPPAEPSHPTETIHDLVVEPGTYRGFVRAADSTAGAPEQGAPSGPELRPLSELLPTLQALVREQPDSGVMIVSSGGLSLREVDRAVRVCMDAGFRSIDADPACVVPASFGPGHEDVVQALLRVYFNTVADISRAPDGAWHVWLEPRRTAHADQTGSLEHRQVAWLAALADKRFGGPAPAIVWHLSTDAHADWAPFLERFALAAPCSFASVRVVREDPRAISALSRDAR